MPWAKGMIKYMEKQILQAITKNCNLACEYCRRYLGKQYDMLSKEENAIELDKSKWPIVKDIIIKHNVQKIMLTGGEPLEYSLLSQYCIYLSDIGCKLLIHTNGLSDKGLEFLDEIHKQNINVEFHVSSELFLDIQRMLRANRLPDKFIMRCKLYGYNVRLKVTMTNLLINKIDDLEKSFYWWKQTGVSTIIFQPVVYVNEKMRKDICLTQEFISVINKIENLRKTDIVLRKMLCNSEESWIALKKILNSEELPEDIINKCITYKKMLSLDTDLNIGNCKTLWNKDINASCHECFDLVCCGFIA